MGLNMKINETIAPKSDQLNADDLIGGPQTFTISEVKIPGGEQPVHVHLAELPGRPWKPSKGMRRALFALWGEDETTYVGRRVTLFRDQSVRWAGEEIGGIRISHMSDIGPKPRKVMETRSKTQRTPFVVQPLADAPTEPTAEEVAACVDKAELGRMWKRSGAERRAQIEQRVADIDNDPDGVDR